jgi:hypothetical protein
MELSSLRPKRRHRSPFRAVETQRYLGRELVWSPTHLGRALRRTK